jgi:hypothetical protein
MERPSSGLAAAVPGTSAKWSRCNPSFTLSIKSVVAPTVSMIMSAVATVHEQMHERTRKNDEEWQCGKDMLLMPDHEVATDHDRQGQEGHALRCLETTEHLRFSFPVSPAFSSHER